MSKREAPAQTKILSALFSDPKYQGKHVIVIGNKIFTANTGTMAAKIFDEQVKQHPKVRPLTSCVPTNNTLIL